MFESRVSAADTGTVVDRDGCVAGLLDIANRDRYQENLRRVRMVASICDIAEIRLADADATGADDADILHDVVGEAAGALKMAKRLMRSFIDTGFELERLPLTAVRFGCGMLDWSHVSVLTSVLGYASDATIEAIEYRAVAAAARLNAPSLRRKVWSLWMIENPAEAKQARALSARANREVTLRHDGDGNAVLRVQLTDLEGAEANVLIDDIVGTVCQSDPRSTRELRVDGLLALLHSEEILHCRCGLGDQCPKFGDVAAPPPRRGHLLQILVDVQTLLGLTSNPATLADGTPLDADLARIIAEDAQWQALLTELVSVLREAGLETDSSDTDSCDTVTPDDDAAPAGDTDVEPADDVVPREDSDVTPGDPDGPGEDPESAHDGTDSPQPDRSRPCRTQPDETQPDETQADKTQADRTEPEQPEPDRPEPDRPEPEQPASDRPGFAGVGTVLPEIVSERLIGRGRVRRGGVVPPVLPQAYTLTRPLLDDAVRAELTAQILGALDGDPTLAAGKFPDGHGGHTTPPAGALTYRPSARVAARVRMRYRTCTFERCEVPSTRCELDHIVPFDHHHPERGGWTIEENLHPVCTGDHATKTAGTWTVAMLDGYALLWTSRSGHRTIALPEPGAPTLPKPRKPRRRRTEPERKPNLKAQTWWEKNAPADTEPPTQNDLRHATSDAARTKIRDLRRRFREHKAIERLRDRAKPAPF